MTVLSDFHNHSCLSPCGSLEMSPRVLARAARAKGLELVALTDHNSARNAPAWLDCARAEGIVPLFGMEMTTAEEVHVLCIFADPDAALGFGRVLEGNLLPLPYDAVVLGDQVVVDKDENILEMPDHYLGSSLTMGYDEVCRIASETGALVIPAHIDRPMFGVISQLGFLPEGPYAAVELVRAPVEGSAKGYTVITGSDAHYPENVGRRPFILELDAGWKTSDGLADLGRIRASLVSGRVRPGFELRG